MAPAHPAPYGWQTHVVRPGDTLSDLAIAHRTTVGALVAHNGLTGGGTYLRLGQRLSVPRTTSTGQQDAARAEGLRWTGYTVSTRATHSARSRCGWAPPSPASSRPTGCSAPR